MYNVGYLSCGCTELTQEKVTSGRYAVNSKRLNWVLPNKMYPERNKTLSYFMILYMNEYFCLHIIYVSMCMFVFGSVGLEE